MSFEDQANTTTDFNGKAIKQTKVKNFQKIQSETQPLNFIVGNFTQVKK